MIRVLHMVGLAVVAAGWAMMAQAGSVTVFAAASLKEAMDGVTQAFEAESGHDVVVSLAGSSALARQIEYGAPADVFLSANVAWMDHLAAKGRIDPATRAYLLGNDLVLVGPKGAEPLGQVAIGEDVLTLLGRGRLAMALVDAVPAGQYGKAALQELGVWDELRASVAQVDNVRAALALVARGEVPLGIVYATDAAASEDVAIVGVFSDGVHPEIVYPVAGVVGRDSQARNAFLTFLSSEVARRIFEAKGFDVIAEPSE
ncbi:molybdate ABC transporter substrate-binding protein [Shimia abyssi]|uniref:Molybdate-binding protein ModA n=1 Tax=Shimia abyssi TaxID=1662395 RepID=A0A2P8F708_9RHOB|nr:molybdate ABC transporter substrate-binding protein [Shimia abyssi]PSL17503.1 molybdate transport system substrate-binding protein [Shimia abyssi]